MMMANARCHICKRVKSLSHIEHKKAAGEESRFDCVDGGFRGCRSICWEGTPLKVASEVAIYLLDVKEEEKSAPSFRVR